MIQGTRQVVSRKLVVLVLTSGPQCDKAQVCAVHKVDENACQGLDATVESRDVCTTKEKKAYEKEFTHTSAQSVVVKRCAIQLPHTHTEPAHTIK